jgi:integrase
VTEKRKPGRPRKPKPVRLASGKTGARVTLDIDGERVRRRVKFDTSELDVARVKIGRLTAADLPASGEASLVTFEEQAVVALRAREERQVSRVDIEEGRLRNHAYPFASESHPVAFGARPIAAITADEVKALLEDQRNRGYSEDHVKHLRKALKFTFESAGLRTMEDPKARLPLFKATLEKTRAVARDEVLLAYLGWQHPVPRHRPAVLMRQTMSAIARCLGGERTNDLHVATWEDNFLLDEDEGGEPTFAEAWVPRTKGAAPQRMEVPEGLSPVILRWWIYQGRPRRGPVFPLLRGESAGGARETQDSHAHAMRVDLRRALGIERWDPDAGRGQKGPVGRWVPGRAMTGKERELFEETKYTRPVDFHSWRRAWSQALAKSGVNVQTSAALTGHASDLRAHGRYLANPTEAMVVPAGAVPRLLLPAPSAPESAPLVSSFGRLPAETQSGKVSKEGESSMISLRARKDSNLRPLASEAKTEATFSAFPHDGVVEGHFENDGKPLGTTAAGQNSRPLLGSLDEALELAVSLAMSEGDFGSLAALVEVAKRRRAAAPDNVSSLDARRRKS